MKFWKGAYIHKTSKIAHPLLHFSLYSKQTWRTKAMFGLHDCEALMPARPGFALATLSTFNFNTLTRGRDLTSFLMPQSMHVSQLFTILETYPYHSAFTIYSWFNFHVVYFFMTIFDVDIDNFEEKPWRYPGVDTSDFFNFGLDEDNWKDYLQAAGKWQLCQVDLMSRCMLHLIYLCQYWTKLWFM